MMMVMIIIIICLCTSLCSHLSLCIGCMEMFQELSFIYVSALMKPPIFYLANNEVYALNKISVLLSLSPNLEI